MLISSKILRNLGEASVPTSSPVNLSEDLFHVLSSRFPGKDHILKQKTGMKEDGLH